MNILLHTADSRGHATHGWLDAHHSFSFASWYNPERMGFGALRVLNDDRIQGGQGFGTHPHKDMEIITIPLDGTLEHKDSMGNGSSIEAGELQVMSAGSGITHSEFNHHADKECSLLQIWVEPRRKGLQPRYQQIRLDQDSMAGRLQQIVSPDDADDGAWIHQDAWFHLSDLKSGQELSYTLKRAGNGIYAFLIEGELTIAETTLARRDAAGITGLEDIGIHVTRDSRLLLIEVPMQAFRR